MSALVTTVLPARAAVTCGCAPQAVCTVAMMSMKLGVLAGALCACLIAVSGELHVVDSTSLTRHVSLDSTAALVLYTQGHGCAECRVKEYTALLLEASFHHLSDVKVWPRCGRRLTHCC